MNALSNLEVTTSLPLNKANDQKKVHENYYINYAFTKSLSFLTCQTLTFKSGKISQSKTLIQTRERNACGREKKRAPIILLSKTK